ncbi:amidase domain-containing protein [Rathayibacter toxicus]|uniref:amidase domain-containing protein n=1 Tax=Rathayibacter toxicus TaxID=145458 RepID=UPI0011B05CB3|nr:amidase domain-containing protein [Rathayibacter toxicus]
MAILADLNQRNAQSLDPSQKQAKENPIPSAAATSRRIADIKKDDANLQIQRRLYAEFGESFTDFSTDVTFDSLAISGARVTVKFTEATTVKRGKDTNGQQLPEYGYRFPQAASLTKLGSNWQVESISHADSVQSIDLPETVLPADDIITTRKSGAVSSEMKQVFANKQFAQSPEMSTLPMFNDIKRKLQQQMPQIELHVTSSNQRSVSLPAAYYGDGPNRTAIVNYALKYSLHRNTESYKSLDDDCTNFVSQALFAGGWKQMIGSPNDETAWFGNNIIVSNTWSRAQPLFDYGFHVTNNFTYTTEPTPGDITFWIWKGSYTFDHTTIVTYVDATGQPYYTEHTNDHVNKSLASSMADNPGAIRSNWAP